MHRYLGRYFEPIYALTRMIVGLLFAFHGLQKLFGLFGGPPALPTPVLYLAGMVELVGGSLVFTGFLASWAAFLCSGMMAVAYFGVHQPRHLFPILNHGELAVLYCWIFLLIAARGPGIWSIGGGGAAPTSAEV
jgi:putative oxidoreductase